MIGGELVSADFSLRALQSAGYDRTEHRGGGLASPGDADTRLREGLLLAEADWVIARTLLLDTLHDFPGNLLAHAALGDIHRRILHYEIGAAHYTAAIRLGLGALVHEGTLPLDARLETERALLASLVGRAAILSEGGRDDAAAADLRRALSWDPSDVAGARSQLAALLERSAEMAMPPAERRA